jgi:hypothetical protein
MEIPITIMSGAQAVSGLRGEMMEMERRMETMRK